MKVLVTGVAGQLGFDVVNELLKRDCETVGSDLSAECPEKIQYVPNETYQGVLNGGKFQYVPLDITDAPAVERVLEKIKPDVVIHCAAWTAVDAAEENQDKVMAVNAGGTRNIALACKKLSCRMMYISTDYVFDGQGEKPWEPDCKDYKPLNVYGRSKLFGEQAVAELLEKFFIVRIAWVFGKNGNNFIKTMLSLAKKYDTIRVVSDQIGTPTYTYDLARLLVDLAETEKYGYYHATNEGGYISWYDFTREIFRQAYALGYAECSEEETKVIPVTTEEYGISKAKRPFNSRLDKRKLKEQGFLPLPDWKDALGRYLRELEEKREDENGTD
ncbi:MAG: dTDP-4-dehydrorhamnose reductase [Lachnospiraceae bacterium]|nr:dTDP-4-dehydrorhamnose reductase [Lachnospiraceae bacterium]